MYQLKHLFQISGRSSRLFTSPVGYMRSGISSLLLSWPARIIVLGVLVNLLTACMVSSQLAKSSTLFTSQRYSTTERPVAGCAANERSFNCDRRAILAMVGDYHVTSDFDETVVFKADYTRRPPGRSNSFETVILIEDTGRQISLQHILMTADGHPIKHWRQDWIYELSGHWHYVGDQRFELRGRDPKSIPGTWTQLVYEANDAPCYAASGVWQHGQGVSSWTSERSWRPLPQREYTTRSDYQLIAAVQRHTITPQGWAHEQDNIKVVHTQNDRQEAQSSLLVRETGFNEYRRITGFDFSPALTYWQETAPYWATVRTRWHKAFKTSGAIRFAFPPDDSSMADSIFELADAYRKNPRLEFVQNQLDQTFRKFIQNEQLAFSK